MLNGWPNFEEEEKRKYKLEDIPEDVKVAKATAWNEIFVGYNVHSDISEAEIDFLIETYGVTWVRVGAVASSGRKKPYEFQYLMVSISQTTFYVSKRLDHFINCQQNLLFVKLSSFL